MELFTSFAGKMFLKAIDTTLYFYHNPFLNPFISTQFQETNDKSSDWEVFWKKVLFIRISQISQENRCVRVSLLIKFQACACNFIKKETLAQVFSCGICEILKNNFFT